MGDKIRFSSIWCHHSTWNELEKQLHDRLSRLKWPRDRFLGMKVGDKKGRLIWYTKSILDGGLGTDNAVTFSHSPIWCFTLWWAIYRADASLLRLLNSKITTPRPVSNYNIGLTTALWTWDMKHWHKTLQYSGESCKSISMSIIVVK